MLAISMIFPSCNTPSPATKETTVSDAGETISNEIETTITATVEAEKYPPDPFVFEYDFASKKTMLPKPTPEKLPVWRGFNLGNLFNLYSMSEFNEEDFEIISGWGFNFVRLPMDYRCWNSTGDWSVIDEDTMKMIDKAVGYGIKYDIHVMLNFHRAPGYTVASPAEETDLWTDENTQKAFAQMWAYFALRYKNVPNEYLSFNLVNEPPDIDEDTYAGVVSKVADAIRAVSPDRLVVADGINYGMKTSEKIKNLKVAQATRGYQPFTLTHYKAEWAEGSENFPVPQWPFLIIPSHLYGTVKSDMRSKYIINHDFKDNYYLDMKVGTVSNEAKLIVRADEKEVYNYLIKSGKGKGEWKTEVYVEQWDVYQNIFDRDYRAEIPSGTKKITIEVTDGDWMTVTDLKFTSVNRSGIDFSITPTTADWAVLIPELTVGENGQIDMSSSEKRDGQWLYDTYVAPWAALKDSGGGVMVGEMGTYKYTAHDVFLRWLEDNLKNFKRVGIGWAIWDFKGGFGVLNSDREGVEYEDFKGYKLDRKMLDVLQSYLDYN